MKEIIVVCMLCILAGCASAVVGSSTATVNGVTIHGYEGCEVEVKSAPGGESFRCLCDKREVEPTRQANGDMACRP